MHCGVPVTEHIPRPTCFSPPAKSPDNLKFIAVAVLVLLLVAAGAGVYYATRPASPPQATDKHTETTRFSTYLQPKPVTFLYSWIETGHGIDVRITVVNLSYWGAETPLRMLQFVCRKCP